MIPVFIHPNRRVKDPLRKLAWNAVTSATGYYIFNGTSSANYTASTFAGTATTIALVSLGLTQGITHYAAVRTYDGSTTSADSNEIQLLNGRQIA